MEVVGAAMSQSVINGYRVLAINVMPTEAGGAAM